MIQVLASGKGEGKTKRLIEMANSDVKNVTGTVIYVDDDGRHIYDLHYDVRFIETTDFHIKNKSEFTGFVCGILAQDRDIEKFYIDGLTNIVENVTSEDLESITSKIEKISNDHNVDFIIGMNKKSDELPEVLRQYVV